MSHAFELHRARQFRPFKGEKMTKAKGQEPIEFLKSKNNLFRDWLECRGHVCEIEDLRVSLNKAPPPLAHPSPRLPAPAPNKQAKPDLRTEILGAFSKVAETKRAFFDWLENPPPPGSPAPPVSPVSRVPPFDIQEVPKAMDKLSMPMSAKLQRRWFAGYENYSRSRDDLRNEIDQNGARYARAMVDDTTIKMDWVLRFPRAKEAFDELVREGVRGQTAINNLKKALTPYRHRRDVLAWNEANSDLLEFHRSFQFQRQVVNSTWGQRIGSFLDRSLTAEGVPDDLTGALGSFNFYAAVDYARFDRQKNEAIVSHLWVYVRDPYEFSDDQYLGHWNARHVAVVPAHQLAGGKGWLQYPVVQGDVYAKDSALYPVTNKDYRDWRTRHQQGGDFMIYTDRLAARVNPPLRVPL